MLIHTTLKSILKIEKSNLQTTDLTIMISLTQIWNRLCSLFISVPTKSFNNWKIQSLHFNSYFGELLMTIMSYALFCFSD